MRKFSRPETLPKSESGTVVLGDSPPTDHWTVVSSKNNTGA